MLNFDWRAECDGNDFRTVVCTLAITKLVLDVSELADEADSIAASLLADDPSLQPKGALLLAMCMYTLQGGFYLALNTQLREIQSQRLTADARLAIYTTWRKYMGLFLCALDSLPRFAGVVYRGIPMSRTIAKAMYSPGGRVRWNGFTSTTKDVEFAREHAIDLPKNKGNKKGDDGVVLFKVDVFTCGVDISAYSCYSGEQEVLIYPGQEFVIVSQSDDQILEIYGIEIRKKMLIY